MAMIQIDKYPDNYNHIPTDIQNRIIFWFNLKYPTVNTRNPEVSMNKVKGAEEILEMLDIHIAYNWVGHRGEWFLVTKEDAEMQYEYILSARD